MLWYTLPCTPSSSNTETVVFITLHLLYSSNLPPLCYSYHETARSLNTPTLQIRFPSTIQTNYKAIETMKDSVGFPPPPQKSTFIFPKHRLVTTQSHYLYKYTIPIFKPAIPTVPNLIQGSRLTSLLLPFQLLQPLFCKL